MEWTLLTKEQYVATPWSGGVTNQLAIAPEGAVYADRDFLWRLSSATVELERSDFTPLPDYNRWLSVLEGEIRVKVGEEEPFVLSPLGICRFDGGIPVESWGTCTDYNLMLRKGRCAGSLECLRPAGALVWRLPGRQAEYPRRSAALYCVRGALTLPGAGVTARAGQLRSFLNYYLPTTLKLLNTYDRMGARGVEGENITGTMQKVEDTLEMVVNAFHKQLDTLFAGEAIDVSADITVMENLMKNEGLTDDGLGRYNITQE